MERCTGKHWRSFKQETESEEKIDVSARQQPLVTANISKDWFLKTEGEGASMGWSVHGLFIEGLSKMGQIQPQCCKTLFTFYCKKSQSNNKELFCIYYFHFETYFCSHLLIHNLCPCL